MHTANREITRVQIRAVREAEYDIKNRLAANDRSRSYFCERRAHSSDQSVPPIKFVQRHLLQYVITRH